VKRASDLPDDHRRNRSLAGSASAAGKSTYAGADKSSRSYRVGLEAGKNGQAEIAAYGGIDILSHQNTAPMSYEGACKGQFNVENGADSDLVEQDYNSGCLDGLNDQSASGPRAGKPRVATDEENVGQESQGWQLMKRTSGKKQNRDGSQNARWKLVLKSLGVIAIHLLLGTSPDGTGPVEASRGNEED
jgi:hypothetical protein